MEYLNRVQILQDTGDTWSWRHSPNGIYSTNVAYSTSNFLRCSDTPNGQQYHKAFKNVWRSFAPRRTQTIIWKMLHQQLPTKDSLIAKNVIISNGDNICALCGSCEEKLYHIFFGCLFAVQIWNEIFQWIKCGAIPPVPPSRQIIF